MSSGEKPRDRAMIGPEIAPGVRRAIRRRGPGDDDLELGVFHEVKDGQPLHANGELVHLTGRDADGWHDVESIYGGRSGPPQVATPEYREGYDRIFGKKQKVGLA